MQQILWQAEHVNLSHNQLEGMQHLQWLSQMTHLDLSHNRLHVLDSLHTKLGNLKCLLLTGNLIESLQGECFSGQGEEGRLVPLPGLDISCLEWMNENLHRAHKIVRAKPSMFTAPVALAAGIAQLVECRTEKPGCKRLMQVRVPWCSGKGFFFQSWTFTAGALAVSVQPLYAIACINICVHVKSHKHWQPYYWTLESTAHTSRIG